MGTKERLANMDRAFADVTAHALNGERFGYRCLTHRDAVQTFNEYFAWLNDKMPMPDDRPTAWWSARRSTLSFVFAGGGYVRFVSHVSQSDGMRAWYNGPGVEMTAI